MSILAAIPAAVNFDLLVIVAEPADDFRPTAGPDFTPTAEEEVEAAELFNAGDEPNDADWDAMAKDAYAMDRVCSGPIL